MKSGSFVDTNIFIYAAAGAGDHRQKWQIAHELLRENNLCVSGQILAEFYYNCTRKTALSAMEIDSWMEFLSKLFCVPVDNALVLEGIVLSRRYRISYWDAAVLAAAQLFGAKILYTEDLNHGQNYGSVQAINPFLGI